MVSLPTSFTWNNFPTGTFAVNSPIAPIEIYCLDQIGNYYTAYPLTFTIWLINNMQYNGATGQGHIVNSSVTATTKGEDGIATFNLEIDTVGNYTFGCYVTDIGGGSYWPAENFLQSPPLAITGAQEHRRPPHHPHAVSEIISSVPVSSDHAPNGKHHN